MKSRNVFFLIIVLIALSACGLPVRYTDVRGSGNLMTIARPVSGFRSVELDGIGKLIIEQGDKESLEITAEDNLVDYLETNVSGSWIHLGVKDHVSVQPTEDITYRLKVKDLKKIHTSGLGNIEIISLKADDLLIDISGSGRVEIGDLEAQTLSVSISGLGDFSASGEVDEQKIEISGAGNVDSPDLASSSTHIQISGAGSATVWVLDQLDVDLSGAGKVNYYGSPKMTTDISGIGFVKKLGEK